MEALHCEFDKSVELNGRVVYVVGEGFGWKGKVMLRCNGLALYQVSIFADRHHVVGKEVCVLAGRCCHLLSTFRLTLVRAMNIA